MVAWPRWMLKDIWEKKGCSHLVIMSSIITIHLKSLRFFAYHGLYDTEKVNGNDFEMDAAVSFHHPEGKIIHIDDTINYATVFDIIKNEMEKPRELLETFLDELALVLKNSFPQITNIDITLYKLTAPIKNFKGKAGVQLQKNYI